VTVVVLFIEGLLNDCIPFTTILHLPLLTVLSYFHTCTVHLAIKLLAACSMKYCILKFSLVNYDGDKQVKILK